MFYKPVDELSPADIEHYLIEAGVDVIYVTPQVITFWLNNNRIMYYIKKQWYTGKGIEDGRGLQSLIIKIKKCQI